MTIQKRNIEIALMLGWRIEDGIIAYIPEENPFQHEVGYIANGFLQFHSEWEWLHAAVSFIESVGETREMYGTLVDITTTYVKVGDHLIDFKITPMKKKEAVFIAVSDFAKQYNKNK